jgi:hypothetical protein
MSAAEKLIGLQNRLNLFEPLTFEIQLSASLERLVNQLEGLPHGWGNGLRCECAAVNDLENFVVEI